MGQFISLIWKNATRNRRRSLLTVASIAASFCLLGVLLAIYVALFISRDESPAGSRRLVTRNRISLTQVMPISYEAKIRQVPGVEAIMAYQWFGGVYKEPKNFFARFACEPAQLFQIYPDYRVAEDEKRAFIADRAGALLGRDLAAKYQLKVGDKITLKGDIFPVDLEFNIRGLFDADKNEDVMWFNIDYLWKSLPADRRDFAGTYLMLTQSAEDSPAVAQQIDSLFRNAQVRTKTESESAFAASFVSFLGNVKLYLFAISAAITFTILLVCGNTIAMSVRERVREVGIMKTLGFTNGEVMGMILGEATVISLLGGFFGCVIAYLLCKAVSGASGGFANLEGMTLAPWMWVTVMTAAVVMGTLAAIWPAWGASRTSIIEAMRYSG
ncbi:MAG: FtsX-like permease family protein [Bryobacteraceae bacterium]|nr:FtsX-like permease family protein [Bryobacteraceae bacterium]